MELRRMGCRLYCSDVDFNLYGVIHSHREADAD